MKDNKNFKYKIKIQNSHNHLYSHPIVQNLVIRTHLNVIEMRKDLGKAIQLAEY